MANKKKPTDINSLASQIVSGATLEIKEEPTPKPQVQAPAKEKNPAAVALGRLGGLKGGPARKEKLSPKRRRQIALQAARARWSKKS